MRRYLLIIALLALPALVSGGCVSSDAFDRKAAEADALGKELARLRQEQTELASTRNDLEAKRSRLADDVAALTGQLSQCETARKSAEEMLSAKGDALSASNLGLRQQISELTGANESLKREIGSLLNARTDDVRKASTAYDDLLGLMKDEIARGEVAVSELKGILTVALFEPLLFAPGSAELKPSSGPSLHKLAQYLTDARDKTIRVEGFTETVLSASWSLQQYPTGWELAAARAIAVTRFLQSDGVNPLLLSAVSYGEYRPLSDNITDLGRARNRRVQVVVIPKE
jgi:chemotaxis protein MotB